MNTQLDRDRIAEEAIGQRHGRAPDYAPTKADLSQDALQLALSSGARASIPEKTAESVGERVADAYSDPARIAPYAKGKAAAAGPHKGEANNRFLSAGPGGTQERFLTVVAGFALGYVTAVLFQRRINAYLGRTPGPFQITKPPQGDGHPRGFVQSTVLKTLTEHPQGMTTGEIVTELGPQGIGRDPIENALGALIQARKISPQDRAGKYHSAAPEVPTAPDQPSS